MDEVRHFGGMGTLYTEAKSGENTSGTHDTAKAAGPA